MITITIINPFSIPSKAPPVLFTHVMVNPLKRFLASHPVEEIPVLPSMKIVMKLTICAIEESSLPTKSATGSYNFAAAMYPTTTPPSPKICLCIPFQKPSAVVIIIIDMIRISRKLMVFSFIYKRIHFF